MLRRQTSQRRRTTYAPALAEHLSLDDSCGGCSLRTGPITRWVNSPQSPSLHGSFTLIVNFSKIARLYFGLTRLGRQVMFGAESIFKGGLMLRCRSFSFFLATLFVMNFGAACSNSNTKTPTQSPDTRVADEAAIRAAVIEWSKAAKAKDVNKAVSFYADDAMVFADKGPLEKGKDNIRADWEQVLALPGPGLTFATTGVDVARSGDMAYDYGTYDFATADKKGNIIDAKGKYVVVWKKQADGSWKVAVDIDNGDAAPAPQPVKRKHTARKRRHH
jgi:uncharacterized protein (TIGR02246 family)